VRCTDFQGEIALTNTGAEALADWRVEFEVRYHAHITNGWYVVFILVT
jgi:hypothetical protein